MQVFLLNFLHNRSTFFDKIRAFTVKSLEIALCRIAKQHKKKTIIQEKQKNTYQKIKKVLKKQKNTQEKEKIYTRKRKNIYKKKKNI